MEILDKSKIESIKSFKSNLKENFIKIFGKKPKESVGIYVAENYVYIAGCFYESGKWHLLFTEKEELPVYNYEEVAADWSQEKINKNDFENAVVTMVTPDKILFKREIELKNIPPENIKEAIYWEYATNYFANNSEFNIAYYPIDDGLYFAAGLEIINQKYVDEFFRKKEIFISNWVTFPGNFCLEMNGQTLSIFDVNINVPADMDMLDLNEYAPAIYGAMVGADLFKGEQKIIFPPLYEIEFFNWKLLSLTVLLFGIILMGSVFLYDNYKIYSLKNEINITNNEIKNLSVDFMRIKIYNDIQKDTKLREDIIAEKTKNRIPFHAVILHLGAITEEGIVLTSVKSVKSNIKGKSRIIIEGEADTIEDVENFLKRIHDQQDIFIKSPKSLKIEDKDEIKFSFSIDL